MKPAGGCARVAGPSLEQNMNSTDPDTLSPSSASDKLAPSHEDIVTRAEALWRQKGCPQGCDEEIWLEAERELLRLLRLERDERDRMALADPRFAFNRENDDLMEQLNERFPGPTGKETTSL
jgi:hypothetical protein